MTKNGGSADAPSNANAEFRHNQHHGWWVSQPVSGFRPESFHLSTREWLPTKTPRSKSGGRVLRKRRPTARIAQPYQPTHHAPLWFINVCWSVARNNSVVSRGTRVLVPLRLLTVSSRCASEKPDEELWYTRFVHVVAKANTNTIRSCKRQVVTEIQCAARL